MSFVPMAPITQVMTLTPNGASSSPKVSLIISMASPRRNHNVSGEGTRKTNAGIEDASFSAAPWWTDSKMLDMREETNGRC